MCYLYVKAHSYGNYILYNDYNFPNPFNQIYIIYFQWILMATSRRSKIVENPFFVKIKKGLI